ncbi:MAG: biotin/lipoyl-binding protein [Clostridia bacterium]|nr:biotin/lipoyl-binding protein [Clostridia bacterium]
MRKFNVTVNGIVYEVEVEEVAAGAAPVAPVAAPVAPKAAPVAAAPAPKAAPAAPVATGSAGAVSIKAPMPGTILDVKVSVGASVKKGDIVAILEAMKMENEIFAPQDGVVASVNVSKGASVNADDLLVSLN